MNNSRYPNYYFSALIAHISFVLYLSFILVWVEGPPFADKISDVTDITTSNTINQIMIIALFLTAGVSLIPIMNDLTELFKKEKFLLFFLLWCLLSILWSDFKLVSIKRYFQVIASVTICCAFLLHSISFKDISRHLKYVLFFYISLSLLAIIFVPGSIDQNFNSWRGLTSHKNQLGQVSLLSLLIWFHAFRHEIGKDKAIALAMSICSFILLLGSKSTTPIVTLGILIIMGIVFGINARTKTLGVGNFYSFFTLLTIIGVSLLLIKADPTMTTSLTAILGKDTSFSGRIDIWSYIYNEAQKHLLLGCGYGSFWVVENSMVLGLYDSLHVIIFQAHMGYLDLLNEIGIIGLILLFLMLGRYSVNLANFKGNHLSLWIIAGVLIINLQESTLFRPNTLSGIIFIFAYLALQVETMRKVQNILPQR
jgi:O-antigen ligase